MTYHIELKTPSKATRDETMLLYALGEELTMTKSFVNKYSRISNDIVRIEVEGTDDMARTMCRVYNALRISKNYMAHVCAITIVGKE